MLSKIFFGLAAASVVMASPIVPDIDFTPDTLQEAQDLIKFLQDVDGQRTSLNQTEWEELLTANGILLSPPPIDHDFLNVTADVDVDLDVNVDKRQNCHETQSTKITKTETFLDWDIQMSNVVCARSTDFVIDVSAGWSVANSITVSGSLTPYFASSFLYGAVGVDFGRTWTSSATNLNRATILAGNCGVMILRATTTRRYGEQRQGCIGSTKVIGTFMADDRLSAQFNGVKWTGGAVSDCQKKQGSPPLSRCNGGGSFI